MVADVKVNFLYQEALGSVGETADPTAQVNFVFQEVLGSAGVDSSVAKINFVYQEILASMNELVSQGKPQVFMMY